MKEEMQSMKIEVIASLFTVLSGLLTVVYTEGSYDIWDLLVGGFVLYVCSAYRKELSNDKRAFLISRIGVSIAAMIVLMAILSFFNEDIPKEINKMFSVKNIEGLFWVSGIIFFTSYLFYKPTHAENT